MCRIFKSPVQSVFNFSCKHRTGFVRLITYCDDIIERHLKRIGRNLNLLDEFFAQHSDKFEWVRPKAGTICMPKLITGEDSTAFCDRTRKESEVLFAPSRLFDYESLHFRLGFGRENMPKALKAFDDFLR